MSCLHELFEAQVERSPGAVAVIAGDELVTFRELNERANQLAHHLLDLGVGPEVLTGVCLERSAALVASLIAILKAGGAYLPLDPGYPTERLALMLAETRAPVLVTTGALRDRLPAHDATVVHLDADRMRLERRPLTNPGIAVTSDHLAYVLYTSGSTGRPKGVAVPQRQLLNRCAWMWAAQPFAEGERACQRTTVNYSVSLSEILGPLLRGTPLVVIGDDAATDPLRLVEALDAHAVTRITVVPSLLRLILDSGVDLDRLDRPMLWSVCGERLTGDLAQRFAERLPHASLVNDYGASEVHATTCYDASNHRDAWALVPIGRPIANARVLLLDGDLRPVPAGLPGHVHVGGAGVARGYLRQPGLTAERFLPDPSSFEPGARMFDMGDVARVWADGMIELLGRRDHQVKVRGMRVELGEVETALGRHPSMRECAVAAEPDGAGDRRLVAYVVPEPERALTQAGLRRYLSRTLPAHMVPAAFTVLERLPRTPNGKVDRVALAALPSASAASDEPFVPPGSELERTITSAWEEVLGVEAIGIHDGFFDLGGHSLGMSRVLGLLRERLRPDLSLVELFAHPTVDALARHLGNDRRTAPVVEAAAWTDAERRSGLRTLRRQARDRSGRT